jgi:hypothetical protein
MTKMHGVNSVKCKNSVPAPQKTHCSPSTNNNQLIMYWFVIAVYCETHTECINALCGSTQCQNFKASGTCFEWLTPTKTEM